MGWPILPPENVTYQLANAALILSYMTTNIILLRMFLTIGAFLFTSWGLFVLKVSIDTTVWNGIFVIINFYQLVRLLLAKRPVKFTPLIEVTRNFTDI